jgi:hypothetical protein
VDGGPTGDIAALVNTVSRDQSPTSTSSSVFSRIFGAEDDSSGKRRWLLSMSLLTVIAIAGGFLAGFVLMQTFFSHK